MGTLNASIEPGRQRKMITGGIIFAILMVLSGGTVNLLTFNYDPISSGKMVLYGVSWALLYLPLPLYLRFAGWQVDDFGFRLDWRVLAATGAAFLFTFPVFLYSRPDWTVALREGIARTGEELFFRGFVYALLLKLFDGKKRAWVWAVLGSSLAFTLIHTHTFLPIYQGEGIGYIFINALILALLRAWSGSILPGILVHGVLNGGPWGAVVGMVIYLLALAVAPRVLGLSSPLPTPGPSRQDGTG